MSRGRVHGMEPAALRHIEDGRAHEALFDAAKAACRPIDWKPSATDVTDLPGTDYAVSRVRGISAGIADLTAGSSDLESGTIYLVYE